MTRKTQKKLRKLLTLVSCAVLLVCVTVVGTVAYLTSTTNTVTNTFTVGKVAITLDEAKVNEYGVPEEGAARVKENSYKLMPGHTYTKDPTVHVAADSEESYVYMSVKVDSLADLKSVFPNDINEGTFLLQNFVDWNTAWEYVKAVESDDTCTYLFKYNTTVSTVDAAAQDMPALFTEVTIPETVTNANIEALAGLQINVKAFAIQADGVDVATAQAAAEGAIM